MSDRRPLLARWRVPLGFVTAIAVIIYATPTWRTLWIGFAVAVAGEAIRVWAAGHLEKSREVTRSGPYRFTRHPLYLGSSFIAVGVMLAANSLVVALAGTVYMVATIGAAILTEEAFLRQEVEAAGFRLLEEGNFLRNPNDPRDKNTPDPPQPKDEFVLKFVKP